MTAENELEREQPKPEVANFSTQSPTENIEGFVAHQVCCRKYSALPPRLRTTL